MLREFPYFTTSEISWLISVPLTHLETLYAYSFPMRIMPSSVSLVKRLKISIKPIARSRSQILSCTKKIFKSRFPKVWFFWVGINVLAQIYQNRDA